MNESWKNWDDEAARDGWEDRGYDHHRPGYHQDQYMSVPFVFQI